MITIKICNSENDLFIHSEGIATNGKLGQEVISSCISMLVKLFAMYVEKKGTIESVRIDGTNSLIGVKRTFSGLNWLNWGHIVEVFNATIDTFKMLENSYPDQITIIYV